MTKEKILKELERVKWLSDPPREEIRSLELTSRAQDAL
jgi:hypothetical protein